MGNSEGQTGQNGVPGCRAACEQRAGQREGGERAGCDAGRGELLRVGTAEDKVSLDAVCQVRSRLPASPEEG